MTNILKKYSIIDIETTGGSARANKITEVAIINIDETETGTEVVGQYRSLIFPERSIPAQIQYLTGITDEMVADAPKFYEIAKKIVELTEGRIFVAHNVHFDYNFIQNEFRDLGYQFKRELLCTVRLARKILPGHPSYSLGKLCERVGIEIKNRHRAMGDAEATVELFKMILKANSANKSVGFSEVYNGLNAKVNFPPYFDEKSYENLPGAPGVYYLWDKHEQLLYIGKAKNIKKRVRQHFDVKSSRTKEFAFKNNIAQITFQKTGNELAALLLEAHEIKARSPLFNRALRRKYFPWALIPYYDDAEVLNFRPAKVNEDEAPIRCGSKRIAESTIKKIYHKAFGIEPSIELARSRELELMLGALGIEEYNARLLKKYQALTYPQESFQIKLTGRSEKENCFIKRFDSMGLHIVYEQAGEVLEKFHLNETPDLIQITLHYLRKNEIKVMELEEWEE